MGILNHLRPLKLEEHGFRQASQARVLLQSYGNNLSQPNRDMAAGLLEA